MILLVVFLVALVVLDVAALRWGADSRDDRVEAITAEQRHGKLLV